MKWSERKAISERFPFVPSSKEGDSADIELCYIESMFWVCCGDLDGTVLDSMIESL